MGVSIDCFAEVLANCRWEFVGDMVPNLEAEYGPEEPELMPEPLFDADSKELAAILTGHYSTIRASAPYVPVVAPRALPSDLSPELEGRLRRQEGKPFFATNWFTKRELDVFSWEDRIMRRRAMVEARVAGLFAGCPRGFPLVKWPAGVPVSIAEWKRDGIEVEWLESYAEIVPEFYQGVMPRLARMGLPDQVRLIVAAYW
jgi:hypothetical protein